MKLTYLGSAARIQITNKIPSCRPFHANHEVKCWVDEGGRFLTEGLLLLLELLYYCNLQPHLKRKRSRVCFFFSFFSRRLAVVEVTPGVLLATFVYWSCSSCRKLRCHLSWCRVHVYGHLNVALVVVFIVVRSLSSSSPSLVTSFVVLSIANLERSLIFFFADRQLLPFEATAPVNIT